MWFAHPIRKHQFKLLADTFLCLSLIHILQAYEAKLEQMAERGSVGRASISDQLKAGKAAAEQAKAERPPKEKPSRGAER